ncbi:MAG: hypothetical protein NTY68_05600 [Candidatus Micrarchaeota archaeon]|nr:hypothetical protein [Candidatus Micrarchaeota archaeon]
MPSIELGKGRHVIAFDLEEEVNRPFGLGYARESFVKLDSILDKVLEYRIRQKFHSEDSQKLIELMASSRANSSFSFIAYKSEIITTSQKDRIDKFKSIRNILVHNSIGELELMITKKQEDIPKFLKLELEKGISLVKEIAGS